jgi:dTMP kinase
MAYQGYGRQLDLDTIGSTTQFATDGLTPHLTIYLDLPVDVGIRRKQTAHAAQSGELNRLDRQTIDFHHRVRDGYLKMAQAEPHRWMVIDAMQAIDDTQRAIRERLETALPEVRKATIR